MKRCSAEQNEREDPQRERRLLAARPHAFAQKVRIERHERNDHDDGKDRKIGPKARDSDRAGSGEQCGGRRSVCAMVKLGPPSVSAARPLRRRKRNCRQHSAMSQSCQLRTHALQQKAPSFDDLVGAGEPRGRYGEAERLGRRREGSGDSVGSVSLAGIPRPSRSPEALYDSPTGPASPLGRDRPHVQDSASWPAGAPMLCAPSGLAADDEESHHGEGQL